MAGQVTIGIDMGGTKVLGLAVDDEGVVLSEVREPTPGRRSAGGPPGENEPEAEGFELVIEALASVTEQLQAKIADDIASVGVGAPGLVDNTGVLRYAPNLPRGTGLDIVGRLTSRLGGMRTVVDNDATCATVAEWAFGAATGVTDAVMVTLGTGIGGGVIAGGHVLRGASGFGGEIGHMVVDPTGPVCPCGKRGCWERFASGSGLGRLARDAAHAGRLDEVVGLAGGDAESVRGEHVTMAAKAGDAGALAVLGELGWWLALGLSNLALVLDPAVMVFGGGLLDTVTLVLDKVQAAFDEFLEGHAYRPEVKIVPALLGERAGAIGAALVARAGDRYRVDVA
ncbi:MAG TPA: ROK family protein [Acidimicrobiales bacterium]|nr:ROK family protein [Acidimicrobiales bacterium]